MYVFEVKQCTPAGMLRTKTSLTSSKPKEWFNKGQEE